MGSFSLILLDNGLVSNHYLFMSQIVYTEVEKSERAPTLLDVLKLAKPHQADRISLVSEAEIGKEAGIVVLLIGKEALEDIRPSLLELAERIGEVKRDHHFTMNLGDDAKHVLQWLAENEIPWTYGVFKYEETPVLLFGLVGTEYCETLAAILTARGLPTAIRN